jgi:hypothetical protein
MLAHSSTRESLYFYHFSGFFVFVSLSSLFRNILGLLHACNAHALYFAIFLFLRKMQLVQVPISHHRFLFRDCVCTVGISVFLIGGAVAFLSEAAHAGKKESVPASGPKDGELMQDEHQHEIVDKDIRVLF